jgi:DeoR/GlpR family transcriptional regulator of sugar metabolism
MVTFNSGCTSRKALRTACSPAEVFETNVISSKGLSETWVRIIQPPATFKPAMNPIRSEEKNSHTNLNTSGPALPSKRHRELLRLLRVRDQITVKEVASEFNVSVDTARRDLDLLASQGLLNRAYGGAIGIQKPVPPEQQRMQRIISHLCEEKRLARALDQVIQDGETLLLNGGFATRCCAEELGSRNLRMVTNNLDIPFEFLTGAQFYVLGGKCQPDARMTVGPVIVSGMNITVDSAVIGVDGITLKEGLTTNTPEEALMAAEMIAAAQRTIVVADSSKMGKRSFAPIGPIKSMQLLITDKELPVDLAQALHEARVEVIIAPEEVAGSARRRNRFTNLPKGIEPLLHPLLATNHTSNRQSAGTMLAANGHNGTQTA